MELLPIFVNTCINYIHIDIICYSLLNLKFEITQVFNTSFDYLILKYDKFTI